MKQVLSSLQKLPSQQQPKYKYELCQWQVEILRGPQGPKVHSGDCVLLCHQDIHEVLAAA